MVEVFRTNVSHEEAAAAIAAAVQKAFPGLHATFDLEDCDRVLRVEAGEAELSVPGVMAVVRGFGFEVVVLEDMVAS